MDLKVLLQRIVDFFIKLNKKQKIALIAAGVLITALLVFLLLYPFKEKDYAQGGYGVLFERLDSSDNALILQHLQQNQIPYKVLKDDTILIPKDKVYEERITLASQGIPKTSKVGFEIFDTKDFGATDFDQNIKLIRAIEGELSRTIESLNPILKANVHIAIPKDSVFVAKEVPPSASVMLKLKPDMKLSPTQILGIKNLIAAAVPKLTIENVKIVNENGESIGEGDILENSKELALEQLRYKQNFENILENKIVNILAPIVGGKNKVVARVNAEFDFSQKKSTKETFDPNNVVRSEQNLEEKKEGAPKKQVGGVPGVVSNIGPVQGLKDNKEPEKYEKSQNTTNYEVGKTISEIKGEFGTLVRLNAAVVVDGKYKIALKDGANALEYEPLSDESLKKINALVKQAIGYNQNRGDDVAVSNFEFNPMAPMIDNATLSEKIMHKTQKILGSFTPLIKYILVFIVLFIFYKKVIVPFSERMLEVVPDEDKEVKSMFEEMDEEEDELNKLGDLRKKVEDQLGLNASFSEEEVRYEIILEKIRGTLKERPDEIATLFKLLIKDEISSDSAKG
ncbi:flagellar basal-body MS-ring/collar protein FliF [Helicobacter pylori]|uniref:flagellar basal-body MS-ring/collar protein FliF n=1 Tax=Helicobacter pylori TaxID=210 RepID=UPI000269FE19|nr:flagellar basal-body MS-ring/collar protein FliF [Helicobacter pylori]EJB71581.1 flagellar M-ring protein FliF [Helicobacter pylori Hp A-8]EJC05089.1 flagellar M-ring protein FliF [Helicobacter pylori Hp P-8]EJC27896.1 flagellar M-ring protein FliF [Helicobacter pylori Hp P-8b]EMH10086.1 flagellar M-ring protein FliF [Helicobacter pylori GAM250AFi]EMH14617.1 flagellar M-ring protein FliF [Helicobacter pylori GAM252Bi]